MLNLITGQLKPDSGIVSVGETSVFGYYRQGGLEFNGDERVIDVVKNVAEYITMADGKNLTASQVLTHFLFPPAKQYGFVNKLSGGEKKRLQLMRVLMKNPNFMILDEPTNDLDIDTLNVLEDFLLNFPGVLMLVSHDRYLIDRLTEQLFIFEGDGKTQIYSGNYTDYRFEQEELKNIKEIPKLSKISAPAPIKNKLSFKEEQAIITLEASIKDKEKQILTLSEELNSGITDFDKLNELSIQIKRINAELEDHTLQWLELSELKNG